MMCARLIRKKQHREPGWLSRRFGNAFEGVRHGYERSLGWALAHPALIMLILAAPLGLNFFLYVVVPKVFFPQQDTGRLSGSVQADQSISFQAMRGKMTQYVAILMKDPDVDGVVGFTGGGQ